MSKGLPEGIHSKDEFNLVLAQQVDEAPYSESEWFGRRRFTTDRNLALDLLQGFCSRNDLHGEVSGFGGDNCCVKIKDYSNAVLPDEADLLAMATLSSEPMAISRAIWNAHQKLKEKQKGG